MGKSFVQSSNQEAVYELPELLELEQEGAARQDVVGRGTRAVSSAHLLPSYHPTRLKFVNAALDLADDVTGGRAGWLQRLFTYLCIGGFAAVVNIVIFSLVLYRVPLPFSWMTYSIHNIVANVVAAEISIMANFIPNDYFTFRHLPGHDRSWTQRCMRFQMTAISGSILTILLEFTFVSFLHMPAIPAQALALILALIYNFTAHHVFTYRHVKLASH
ncbi:MAG: GtrA family protein [Chloroflexota bacterium]|nr:GtrA family protein [Chloroflexota bacterium]